MEWTHRTAVVNGIHIHYVTHGHGAPVILLHGWPEFWYGWRQQIPVLGERFEVIVPDMRGFGYSDKPLTGYDTRTAASDIYELARLLGHQRVALVAHDIGARVAYRFTLDHEDMVSRLALLDSTPRTSVMGRSGRRWSESAGTPTSINSTICRKSSSKDARRSICGIFSGIGLRISIR